MSGRAIKRVYKDTRMAGYLFYLQVAYKLFQHNKNGTNLTYLRHFPLPVGNFLKRNYNQKHLKYLKHFLQSKNAACQISPDYPCQSLHHFFPVISGTGIRCTRKTH